MEVIIIARVKAIIIARVEVIIIARVKVIIIARVKQNHLKAAIQANIVQISSQALGLAQHAVGHRPRQIGQTEVPESVVLGLCRGEVVMVRGWWW